MPRTRKVALISAGIACLSIALILGITALVFRQKGYLAFRDPCIGVESFQVIDFDVEKALESNPFLGILDLFTDGMASELIPTQVTMTIRMILELNNTNPYDIECEQADEGVIELSADDEGGEDLLVGTWNIESSILKGNARSEIPVEVTATVDLLDNDIISLGVDLVTGQSVTFRVTGGIEGFASWAPDLRAHITLICLADVDNIFGLETGASVSCRHSAKVGQIIEKNGEVEFGGEDITSAEAADDEVDSACLV